jgi:hypothetical protein
LDSLFQIFPPLFHNSCYSGSNYISIHNYSTALPATHIDSSQSWSPYCCSWSAFFNTYLIVSLACLKPTFGCFWLKLIQTKIVSSPSVTSLSIFVAVYRYFAHAVSEAFLLISPSFVTFLGKPFLVFIYPFYKLFFGGAGDTW